jgi:enoyl-CoA hydratase/carnithine racemase
MTDHILTAIEGHTGIITLDRPAALNSLSLEMVRAMTKVLMDWRDHPSVRAVVVKGSSERAYCAGGDIRFFHQKGSATHTSGAALVEDFFNEEYALNHLVHTYPKPYVALMDGVVMGGGMGIAQAGPQARLRVVTERTKMAMPEVGIGLFPDVGGSWFLSRAPGEVGTYLAVTGEMIGAADAIHAGLADVFVPGEALPALQAAIVSAGDARAAAQAFAQPFAAQADPTASRLAQARGAIDHHFAHRSVQAIMDSLAGDSSEFAAKTLASMQKRSPLMMSVALEQVRRGGKLGIADCLRMERTMVRRCFEHGEVIEGVRALAIDKDHAPKWNPSSLAAVSPEMVEHFFCSAWPDYAHPLRHLNQAG